MYYVDNTDPIQPMWLVRFDYNLPLWICGKERGEDVGVCMIYMHMDSLPSVLLVSAADRAPDSAGAGAGARTEPRVIAKAIAAFQANNAVRRRAVGRAPLHEMTIPCITMSGPYLSLYLAHITEDLSVAVRTGQHPSVQTVVQKLAINMDTKEGLAGMDDGGYRRKAFEYLLAFKDLAQIHWTALLA